MSDDRPLFDVDIVTDAHNHASKYAHGMMKSATALTNGTLWEDYQLLMKGEASYLRSLFCDEMDFRILQALTEDLKQSDTEGLINWSKHLKHENPLFSPTFNTIVQIMADYFDVEVFATRLNFYPDNRSWKPYHHDSHAYCEGKGKEDFTMGASFGHSRSLSFMHPSSDQEFSFPQHNGDVFAFTSAVNKQFQHGVPRAQGKSGPRFSVIAWGRRRTINQRNGSATDQAFETYRPSAELRVSQEECQVPPSVSGQEVESERIEVDMEMNAVTGMVDQFVDERSKSAKAKKNAGGEKQKKKASAKERRNRGRVQGGWGGSGGSRRKPKKSAE